MKLSGKKTTVEARRPMFESLEERCFMSASAFSTTPTVSTSAGSDTTADKTPPTTPTTTTGKTTLTDFHFTKVVDVASPK